MEGVNDAILHYEKSGGVGKINAVMMQGDQVDWSRQIRPVEFDLAVTSAETLSGTGKPGAKFLTVLDIWGEIGKKVEASHANRVKFSIPIVFPAQLIYGPPEKPWPSGSSKGTVA